MLLDADAKQRDLAVFALFDLLCKESSMTVGVYDARVRVLLYDMAFILQAARTSRVSGEPYCTPSPSALDTGGSTGVK